MIFAQTLPKQTPPSSQLAKAEKPVASDHAKKNLVGEQEVSQERYRTPRAGERLRGTFPLFGFELDIPERDRSKTMALNLGIAVYQPNLGNDAYLPFGAFYYANYSMEEGREKEHRRRLRAILVALVNFVDFFDATWNESGFEFAASWENNTLPVPSSLILNGTAIQDSEIYWGYLRAGFGLGWRTRIAPWHFDNNFSIHLYYEPGLLYFKETGNTANNYVVPSTTYEDRIHLRIRADAMERNIMELRHEGWAGGIDVLRGHRYHWKDHDFNGSFLNQDTRTYWLVSSYVTYAGNLGLDISERHRFVLSLYGAFAPGEGLDRYSAFRLGGGPTGDESEALSRGTIPGFQFDEYIVSRYILFSAEYRLELLFFMYLHFKASIGVLRRMELSTDQQQVTLSKNEAVGSLGIALTTGFAWNSQLYIEYVNDRGLFRGKERKNGHNFLISWSKEL